MNEEYGRKNPGIGFFRVDCSKKQLWEKYLKNIGVFK